ncbi:phosphonate metabolism protein/1,5-bisphosphokinase (PRPP-forming) PhnN [Telmatospirillum sp. J64-1]|uniref:phosphonate metabolism protein/1,5-bisphosphokinase (PRPP-forming) PhnN n=1 Tax=Telmatospirillum sp. J64-1 TaxID=2502183 RepID=UPI00115EAFE9|nr:phosphonate metabolism protein/1,5-bisphosphokinase (PRPP-forming) PhnN [Telmatospirillum sp. J64-1]
MKRGRLFLVVGPSGAGKDSILEAARTILRHDRRFLFPRRVITRPEEAGGENHIASSLDTFEQIRRSGGFALSWQAHDLSYGIPAAIHADLEDGFHVVANVSRSVIEEARRRLAPVTVIVITAEPEILAERLAARGRESAEDIAARLRRAGAYLPDGPDVAVINNSGSLGQAVSRFLSLLSEEAQPADAEAPDPR